MSDACSISNFARAGSKSVGDCPDFAMSSEPGTVGHAAACPMVGTVSLFETSFEASSSLPAGDVAAAPGRRARRGPVLSRHSTDPGESLLPLSWAGCPGAQAELRLDLREGLFGAGASGRKIVAPGDAAASELYRRITAEQPDRRMPPAEARLPLSDAQLATLRRWIEAGSRWQEHWSYTPIVRPDVPELAEANSASNAIDRFLLVPLRQAGLSLAEPADDATLVRRLSLDLTGLPPTGAEVTAFAANPSETAYAAVVERFLASPHYGERMAVYWLDLVRYADSCGYHSDVDQPISPYRDYVIGAFRDNMPFDQFTREQLAGDLLPSPTLDQRIATGYNRLSKTTEEGARRPASTWPRARRIGCGPPPACGWPRRSAAPNVTTINMIPLRPATSTASPRFSRMSKSKASGARADGRPSWPCPRPNKPHVSAP